jgi:methionine-gamma-lyase
MPGADARAPERDSVVGVDALGGHRHHARRTPAAIEAAADEAIRLARERGGRVGLVVLETPANPTDSLVDLRLLRDIAGRIGTGQPGGRPPIAVDNTFLGPVFQKPLEHGSDLVMYSPTKYVGGHSDLVAGGVAGSRAAMKPVKALRGAIGTQLDPNTASMIMRSMEAMALRMRASAANARVVAEYLAEHPKVASVSYLGLLAPGDKRRAVFEQQCGSAGSTFAFCVKGGQA